MKKNPCPVCQNKAEYLDQIDFSRSCEEKNGFFLPASNRLISYFLCDYCNFCFSPEIMAWTPEKFKEKIYNNQYLLVDPDYLKKRPLAYAAIIISMFEKQKKDIYHLDYGGGRGLLSTTLRKKKFNSASYDPFVNIKKLPDHQFNLITAFEVFEHAADVNQLFEKLALLLSTDGIIIFSTLLNDQKVSKGKKLDWWYAAPRNGHISLFSKKSMGIMAKKNEFNFASFNNGLHILFKNMPLYAKDILSYY